MTEALLIMLLAAALVMIVLQLVILLRNRQGLAQDSLDRLSRRSDEIGERLVCDCCGNIGDGWIVVSSTSWNAGVHMPQEYTWIRCHAKGFCQSII